MKKMEVVQKSVGNIRFYIRYFGAFYAAKTSGDLAKVFVPIFASLFGSIDVNDNESILDKELSDITPSIVTAFSSFDGNTLERLVRQLLIDDENVTFDDPNDGSTKKLTYDEADELFCGDLGSMYMLCAEVIRLNYGGFFKSLGIQSGSLTDLVSRAKEMTSANTAN